MAISNAPFPLRANSHKTLRYTVTDASAPGGLMDLTGFSIRWSMAQRQPGTRTFKPNAVSKSSDVDGDIVVSLPDSTVDVVLKASDTVDVPPGDYEFQLAVIDGDGEPDVVATGRITLEASQVIA